MLHDIECKAGDSCSRIWASDARQQACFHKERAFTVTIA
jgi:hypothetical protein